MKPFEPIFGVIFMDFYLHRFIINPSAPRDVSDQKLNLTVPPAQKQGAEGGGRILSTLVLWGLNKKSPAVEQGSDSGQ